MSLDSVSRIMRADHLARLNNWFMEQLAVVKAEGVSERDFEDGAVADLGLCKIFQEHFEELRFDEEFIDEAFAVVSSKTSPSYLRGVATQGRDQGEFGIGYYLDLIADDREKESV
jgi:hypothetical protein